jgi:hypothetical protein
VTNIFLRGLIGFPVPAAEIRVTAMKYKARVVCLGAAINPTIKPRTVILWHRGGKVVQASAGDPSEVENI